MEIKTVAPAVTVESDVSTEKPKLLTIDKLPPKVRDEAEKIRQFAADALEKINSEIQSENERLATIRQAELLLNRPVNPEVGQQPDETIKAKAEQFKVTISELQRTYLEIQNFSDHGHDDASTWVSRNVKKIFDPKRLREEDNQDFDTKVARYNQLAADFKLQTENLHQTDPQTSIEDPASNNHLERAKQLPQQIEQGIRRCKSRKMILMGLQNSTGLELPLQISRSDKYSYQTLVKGSLDKEIQFQIDNADQESARLNLVLDNFRTDISIASQRIVDETSQKISSQISAIRERLAHLSFDNVPTIVTQETGTILEKISSVLSSRIWLADKINSIMESIYQQNEDIGNSESVLTPTGSQETMFTILESGHISSHRELLRQKGSFGFNSGGVEVSSEGLKTKVAGEVKGFTWEDWHNGKAPKLIKNPFAEFDQVLLSKDSLYNYGEGISIIFPAREIYSRYQFTANQDGIHIFDSQFDSDNSPQNESDLLGLNLSSTRGATIDLATNHYLIQVDQKSKQIFEDWVHKLPPNHPLFVGYDTIDTWIDQRVVYAEEETKDVLPQTRKKLFSQNIDIHSGAIVPTGNKADTASHNKSTDTYLFMPT